MKRAISYSLFGFGKPRQDNCFDFPSYVRGLMLNIRVNRLIYPGWEIVLHTDSSTYGAFASLFNCCGIIVKVLPEAPLCLAMLWRLMPVFETKEDGTWAYSHVLCRDLDSPTTYREAQAVQYWINKDKAMHAITDSVSHNLPLMGGMIGMRPAYFTERVGQTWAQMMALSGGMNFDRKGSDQTFLNQFIYPKFATKGNESITQHYILGHGDTFLNDWHNTIHDTELDGVPFEMSESNSVAGHIGAAGAYTGALNKFLYKYRERFADLIELEKNYPVLFYWTQDETFK